MPDQRDHAIRERVKDARVLWAAGRREGAFVLALVAVAAAARLAHPEVAGDRARFEIFFRACFSWRVYVEYHGQQMALETVFYKLLRCQLVHEADLPEDVRFIDGAPEGELLVRAGGAPSFVLSLSPGWFHALINSAQSVASSLGTAAAGALPDGEQHPVS